MRTSSASLPVGVRSNSPPAPSSSSNQQSHKLLQQPSQRAQAWLQQPVVQRRKYTPVHLSNNTMAPSCANFSQQQWHRCHPADLGVLQFGRSHSGRLQSGRVLSHRSLLSHTLDRYAGSTKPFFPTTMQLTNLQLLRGIRKLVVPETARTQVALRLHFCGQTAEA